MKTTQTSRTFCGKIINNDLQNGQNFAKKRIKQPDSEYINKKCSGMNKYRRVIAGFAEEETRNRKTI